MGFEPTPTEFRSEALKDLVIRPRLLQFHLEFGVRFHFDYCLRQSPPLVLSQFYRGYHMSVAVYECSGAYYIFYIHYIYLWVMYVYLYICHYVKMKNEIFV